jgi:hypothetical protein
MLPGARLSRVAMAIVAFVMILSLLLSAFAAPQVY